ncbi:MAG: hypothetical protein K0U80_13995 [Actinomycetia bacterium]|nr:hypothetical protein [Actinomycetes bacterium]MCH9759184.1 hypothetical protein [Actinomycetes bacterium]
MTVTDTDVTTEAADDEPTGDAEATAADTVTEDAEADVEDQDQADDERGDEDGDTFPREVVEKLRRQNARYRERAKAADGYAQRLHAELVRATGRLADPSDLEFDEGHLDDPDALAAAIDDLLDRKPHLASRKPVGDIGQGARGNGTEQVGLLSILKGLT